MPVVGIGLRPPSSRRITPEAVTGPASPVRLNKPCAKEQFGSSTFTTHHRAGLPVAPPSISPEGLRLPSLRPQGAGFLGTLRATLARLAPVASPC